MTCSWFKVTVLGVLLACSQTTALRASFSKEVLADAPASYWRFGETSLSQPARDEIGAANGAWRSSGVTLGAPGALVGDPDTAMKLDGQNGGVEVAGSLYDFGGTPAFAVECWVAPQSAPDSSTPVQRIATHRTGVPLTGWRLFFDGALKVVFERWDNDTMVGAMSSSPVSPGAFSHIAVSSDGATMTLYVNGTIVASGVAGSVSPNATATNLSWGAKSDHLFNEFLNGVLDEGVIYTHSLSSDRVAAHYHAAIGH